MLQLKLIALHSLNVRTAVILHHWQNCGSPDGSQAITAALSTIF
jgi:hypothetical protein